MTEPTDTNQASELYELCKEVYELFPFWAGTDMIYGKEQDGDWKIMPLTLSIPKRNRIPLYTSDYLLDRLPYWVSVTKEGKYATIPKGHQYSAQIVNEAPVLYADTPLKALLKLTIAISEAGELK